MSKFSLLVPQECGPHKVLAEADTLEDALRIAEQFANLNPVIVANGERPRLITHGTKPRRPAKARLTTKERREVERDYLALREQLAAAGRSREEIDRLLPLTPEGDVPWGD